MAKDMHKKSFDENTMLKLEIFEECFEEWLPVFVHSPFIDKVLIYDLFAGSGMDKDGVAGSPLILLDVARRYCQSVGKPVEFMFNEYLTPKYQILQENIETHLEKCRQECVDYKCKLAIDCTNKDFQSFRENDEFLRNLSNPKLGKFVILDQYGFKQVEESVFTTLVNSPHTDFIFFITSSNISRFKNHEYVKKYIDTENIDFDSMDQKNCHRLIVNQFFKRLIPKDRKYYIHQFTIKKGANYYGLVFCTGHSLGMEKFLKVCWNHDKLSGESNCNIDNDFEEGELFYTEVNTNKLQKVKKLIKEKIFTGEITNNLQGMEFCLTHGCQPIVFVDVINTLVNIEKSDRINIVGKFNKRATNIHRIPAEKIYQIQLVE